MQLTVLASSVWKFCSQSQSDLIQSFLFISGPVQIQVPGFRGRHLAKVWCSVAVPRGAPAGGADGWRDAVLWGEHRPHSCHRILWIQISECPCVVSALKNLADRFDHEFSNQQRRLVSDRLCQMVCYTVPPGGLSLETIWKMAGAFKEILGMWLEEPSVYLLERQKRVFHWEKPSAVWQNHLVHPINAEKLKSLFNLSHMLSNSALGAKPTWRERTWPTSACTAQSAQQTKWKLTSSAGSVWRCGKVQLHAPTAATTTAASTTTWSSSRTARTPSSLRCRGPLAAPPSGPVPPAVRGWSTTRRAVRTSSALAVRSSSASCAWSSLKSAWRRAPTSSPAAVVWLPDRPPYLCGTESKIHYSWCCLQPCSVTLYRTIHVGFSLHMLFVHAHCQPLKYLSYVLTMPDCCIRCFS